MIVTILVFVIILSILILIHEAGHFFTAKFFKIKVEEFGFGLPPRIFGIKFRETLYSINWLPIGGFVKLYGEDDAGSGSVNLKEQKIPKEDLDRAFYTRPIWQRALVIVAGVVMNFILAVTIISVLFSFVGVQTPGKEVIVGSVVKGSPAEMAGLKPGDKILKLDNTKMETPMALVEYTKKHLGKEINLTVKTEDSKTLFLKVVPRLDYPANQGPIGVSIYTDFVVKKYPIYEAPFVGTKEALNQSWLIVKGLSGIVVQLATKGTVPTDVAGPVGIAQITGKVVEIGPFAILSFVSLLSLNLAIINILPIPALDGGRLLFIAIEAITRKKVSPKVEGYAHTIGMVVLLGLIVLITLHDLIRVFSGQPIIPELK